jgi:hypothetical protein
MTENPKELFDLLLSNARRSAERTTRIPEELSDLTQDIDTKEALAARVFLSDKILSTLDQCFRLIRARPIARTTESGGGLQGAFIAESRAGGIRACCARRENAAAGLSRKMPPIQSARDRAADSGASLWRLPFGGTRLRTN